MMVTPSKIKEFSRHIEKLLNEFGNRDNTPGFWCRSHSWVKDRWCLKCPYRHTCPGKFPRDRKEIRKSEFNEGIITNILMALLECPKTKYTLSKKDVVASSGTVYNYCQILLERGLIEINKTEKFQPTGMDKKYYQINLVGLVHLIKNETIKPEDGFSARIKGNISFPLHGEEGMSLGLRGDYKKYLPMIFGVSERIAPEIFYGYLCAVDLENHFLPPIIHLNFAVVWVHGRLQRSDPGRFKKWQARTREITEKDRGFHKFFNQNKKAIGLCGLHY